VAQILLNGAALAAAIIMAATPARAQDQAAIAAQIHPRLAIADAFDRAQLTKDAAALDRMVADDLVFIESNGKRSGKQAFIAGWTAPGDRFDPITLVDRQLTMLGPDVFLVSAETVLTGTSSGTRFASAFRFTDIFRRIGGHWRVVHIQVTRLPAGK